MLSRYTCTGGADFVSTLLLLRHAKASRASGGMRDIERPLDQTGRKEADLVGNAMRQHGYAPASILCSSAARTRETLDCLASFVDTRHVNHSEMLYSSDAAGYLAAIRQAEDHESLLVVGHNPMTEELAASLAGAGTSDAHKRLRRGFPTCGLAVFDFASPLADIAPGTGKLVAFFTPDGLRNA